MNLQKQKDELKKVPKVFSSKASALIMGGFGLVAALAWNDAIQTLFAKVFGDNPGSLWAKFLYAVIVTATIVIVSIYIGGEEK